jgi:hypothetical protein
LKMVAGCSSESMVAKLYGFTSQKNVILIFPSVRTLNKQILRFIIVI